MAKKPSKATPSSSPTSPKTQLKVNQKFARVYEERKRKEELTALKRKRIDTDDDDSSSETEDEDGEELTKELDADIQKTLKLIRKKDPAIYDSSIAFFKNPGSDSDKDDNRAKRMKQKTSSTPLYYKDLVRQQAIAGDVSRSEEEDESDPVQTYQEEQNQIKQEFLALLKEKDQYDESDDLDGGFFTVRKKTDRAQRQEEEDELELATKDGPMLKHDTMDPEKFLKHYLSSESWKDKTPRVPHYEDIVRKDEEDAEELAKAEDFEHTYNFRFEEQGSSMIQTHSRRIDDTIRREDDSRKRKRAERKERKAMERQKKEEELRRLKNLKQGEIEQKLQKIARLMGEPGCGKTVGLRPEDLEGDFDPEEYDKRMQAVFDDQYYEEEDDMEKPTWDDKEEQDLFGGLPDEEREMGLEARQELNDDEEEQIETMDEEGGKVLLTEELQQEKQKYLDELYGLDYEDLIGDLKCRFKYRQVPTNNFGLTVDEIMAAEDKELKQLVSLKRMAPYADAEYKVDRKQLKTLKKSLRIAQQENRRRKNKKKGGEVEKAEATAGLTKKRTRNKRKRVELDEGEAGSKADVDEAKVKSKTVRENHGEGATDEGCNKPETMKRRRKKRGETKNVYASTGLPTSRLESYKLL